MKRAIVISIVMLFVASVAFAADFSPTKLVLTAEETVQYSFDGSELTIPVEVGGTSASLYFFVFTKGKADDIIAVQNGFLGWHYVNKIDTCVYMSSPYSLGQGANNVTWDGKDNDGADVADGDYTYYMWAFDNMSSRIQMTNFINCGAQPMFIENDEAGNPLTNPLYMNATRKWIVGTDPLDDTLMETTAISNKPAGFATKYAKCYQLDNQKIMYVPIHNSDSGTGGLARYEWVPAGDAILDTDFEITWGQNTTFHMSALTDGNYVYVTENNYKEIEVRAPLHVIDYEEGEYVDEIDLGDWWGDLDDYDAGAQMNGGPGTASMRDGLAYLGCHCSCLRQVVNPMAYFEDVEDAVVWVNDNGDYVFDHNFEETSEKPWVCNDYNVGPYTYNLSADDNFFSVSPSFDLGSVSFGLLAPDGTGIGHLAYAGETASPLKYSSVFLDGDTPFDGLYSDNESGEGAGMWFIGHDSISGTISSSVAVEADAPTAFAVAQNSPNPFNPTTTISFSLAQAGNVNVDIYNVAGQKVDTIVNEYLDSGSHSVVWDASDFSAGVYFYTVKGGDFSKTMKMTLVK